MIDVTLENIVITPSVYSDFLRMTNELEEKALMDEINQLENEKQ